MNLKRDFDAVIAWGITVTLAYFLTPAIGMLNISGIGLNYQILIMWTLLMTVPIYYSYREGKGPLGWKTLNPIWALFMIVGIVGNFLGQIFLTGESLVFSYYQKWFLLPAALFAYTAYEMSGFSKKLYAVTALANLIAGVYLFIDPVFQLYTFPVAGIIQGLPMIIDWYFRKAR